MKKLFLLFQGLLAFLFLPLPAFAAASVNVCNDASGIAAVLCGLGGPNGDNIAKTLQNIIVFFVVLAVIIAILYLIYGGIKWVTSRGDKAEVESARNHILAAIIGLVVIFLAIFFITIALTAFGIPLNDLEIPTIGGTASSGSQVVTCPNGSTCPAGTFCRSVGSGPDREYTCS